MGVYHSPTLSLASAISHRQTALERMQTYPLQLDSMDVKKPGLWPWVIALTATTALLFSLSHAATGIESSIHSAVVATVSSASARGVEVDVDGRDVTLSGSLPASIDRASLVNAVSSLEGVRVVSDDMTKIDPVDKIKTQRADFQKKLQQIDASAVSFQPNSSSLSLSSESALLQTAKLLKAQPERQIKIAGHTDNSGSAERNLTLSGERAQVVADFLTDRGVSPAQLIVQGYGHTRPLYDNNTEEGRAKNRRIEFIYMK